MPDFERIIRDSCIERSDKDDPSGITSEKLKNYYKGLDDARKEIAYIFGTCVGIGCLIYLLMT